MGDGQVYRAKHRPRENELKVASPALLPISLSGEERCSEGASHLSVFLSLWSVSFSLERG